MTKGTDKVLQLGQMEAKENKSASKSAAKAKTVNKPAPIAVPSISLSRLSEIVRAIAKDESARGRGFVSNVCRRIMTEAEKAAKD